MKVARAKSDLRSDVARRVRAKRGDQSQTALATALGWPQQKLSNIELGKTRLAWEDAQDLADALGCTAMEFFADLPPSLPVLFHIAGGFSERLDHAVQSPPFEWVAAPRFLQRPDECFAAVILDDSADRIYPAGSTVFVRRREKLDTGLEPGNRVLIANHRNGPGGPEIFEVLVGRVDLTMSGDIIVTTASRNTQVVPSYLIPRAKITHGLLAESAAHFRPGRIDYAPAADDRVTILGRIDGVTAPG